MDDRIEFEQATMGAMDLVYNLARRSVPTREDAQDLVQETYLHAYRAWKAHRRPRKAEAWLATICLNLARSRYRRLARRPVELPWLDEFGEPRDVRQQPGPEADDARLLHEALWQLNEEQRIAITLVDLDGFSVAEAARIMATPRGTVLSRLHRGRRTLAALLEPHLADRSQ
jgi:RNA polymerase sigma-70 factor (ECF subfamily)